MSFYLLIPVFDSKSGRVTETTV